MERSKQGTLITLLHQPLLDGSEGRIYRVGDKVYVAIEIDRPLHEKKRTIRELFRRLRLTSENKFDT